MMKSATCCFSGHRNFPAYLEPIIRCRTENVIERLITERQVRYFGVGGALGYDTLAAGLLFEMRKRYPHIKVILVYPFDGFTSRWGEEERSIFANMLPMYDKRVCIAKKPSREAFLMRNRHLVDGSAYCVAYCTTDVGGTAYTLRYAKGKGLWIRNIANEVGETL